MPLAPSRRARATMGALPALLLLVALLGLQRGLRVIVESDGVAIVLVLLAAVTVAGPLCSLGSGRGRRR